MTSNLSASVRQRLTNKAKETSRPFQEVLQYFAMERFLYCLSRSPYADKFVLKGALMFAAWEPRRLDQRKTSICLPGWTTPSRPSLKWCGKSAPSRWNRTG